MSPKYLGTQADWGCLASLLRAIPPEAVIGIDTETYGHNVRESSPAYRASIHVWSLSVVTQELHPRGYYKHKGWVLPVAALPTFADVLASGVTFVAHNANHDLHALANIGFRVSKVVDTLDVSRLVWPGRDAYGLKALEIDKLGKDTRYTFQDVTAAMDEEFTVAKPGTVCACGEPKCRKTEAKWGAVHAKTECQVVTARTRKVPCPLETITEGHPRWDMLVEYAAEDAVSAPELYQLVCQRLDHLETKLPALPWGEV